jgi:hypothetical protein
LGYRLEGLNKEQETPRAILTGNEYPLRFINQALSNSQKQNSNNRETKNVQWCYHTSKRHQKVFAQLGNN